MKIGKRTEIKGVREKREGKGRRRSWEEKVEENGRRERTGASIQRKAVRERKRERKGDEREDIKVRYGKGREVR